MMTTRKGYTLVEMLVVLAIITLLLAIVLPRLSFQQRGAGLKGAASELSSALRTARRLAITNREVRALALDIYAIPAEFMIMRPKGASWEQDPGVETHTFTEQNIAVVGVTDRNWGVAPYTLNITRTDDMPPIDGVEGTVTIPSISLAFYNPGAGNGLINSIYYLIRFQPTGTADDALIYLWNIQEGRHEIPIATPALALSNITKLGVPPGLLIDDPTDQSKFFRLPNEASVADAYYYTLVVNPITGGVTVYDYAWGIGGPNPPPSPPRMRWDRKKDGQ